MHYLCYLVSFLLLAVNAEAFDAEQLKEWKEKDPEFVIRLEEHVKKWPTNEAGQASGVTGFSCSNGVSATVPTNVHSVRPGDIKVVAAFGDSITAGNGAGATNVLEMLLQYRGMTFAIGGDDDLEHRVTIPNILRKFNPNVFGQSHGIGDATEWPVAYLNTAEPGMRSDDLVNQAHEMIAKMREHPDNIDMVNDWKLITIFIGGNDMCRYCHDSKDEQPEVFISNIIAAIQVLQENIPRLIVNVMSVLHVELVRQIDADNFLCIELHKKECVCVDDPTFTVQEMSQIETAFTMLEQQLMMNGTFDTSDDFTLVVQPLISNTTVLPRLPDGSIDLSYFTPDCFHFSAKLHSVIARGLWNNMLQPVGSKQNDFGFGSQNASLSCPDPACPFIRTTKNSANCAPYLTPAAG
uniref:Phospholipase B1, membrane-associated n=2 Tax=Plectus sambesii TaxID=2011161 RepID=A0A914X6H5_9BILA